MTATDSPRVQSEPIGPTPTAEVCLVGALLYSRADDAAKVLALVQSDDLCDPALAAVLDAQRALSISGRLPSPQFVLDHLRQTGELRDGVARRLEVATTSGADRLSAREYAAAVVSLALRGRVESVGVALQGMAVTAAEVDLLPLVARYAETITACALRLTALRGE